MKIYSFCLIAVVKGKEHCMSSKKVFDDEDKAISKYFEMEKKKDSIKESLTRRVKTPVELYLNFNVSNTQDSSLDTFERYNFFSKIQEIKDKARLPFKD